MQETQGASRRYTTQLEMGTGTLSHCFWRLGRTSAPGTGGRSPLHPAAVRGQTEVVRIFLEAGNNASEKDLDSETTLDEARANTPMSPHSWSAGSASTASRGAGS